MALFALWFTIAWFPLLGSGPQWGWLVSREAADCSECWWYHALYVHNHLPAGNFCMGHTWYVDNSVSFSIFYEQIAFGYKLFTMTIPQIIIILDQPM